MQTKGKWYGMMTAGIILLIGIAFILTDVPVVQDVIAHSSPMPLYRSNDKAVCLITVFEDDLSSLSKVAAKAASAGIPLTIAVCADKVASSLDDTDKILSFGDTLALYGLKKDGQESSEQWMQESYDELLKFKENCKADNVLYIPYLGQYTGDVARFCGKYGLQTLLYCKDSRAFGATSQQDFAQVLARRAVEGDFIYITIDKNTDFTSISKYFAEKTLTFDTVGKILFH